MAASAEVIFIVGGLEVCEETGLKVATRDIDCYSITRGTIEVWYDQEDRTIELAYSRESPLCMAFNDTLVVAGGFS